MSDDFFDDDPFDDGAFEEVDRVVETLQATQRRAIKKRRLDSSPGLPDIRIDENGGYVYAEEPEEDEIVDERQTFPPVVAPAPRPASPARAVDNTQLRDALKELETLRVRAAEATTTAETALKGEQAKTGEVENLRRQHQKEIKAQEDRNKQHQDALAALKAELEEERRQRKLEGERWNTELTFKEQEMESTRRRKPKAPTAGASQWAQHKSPHRPTQSARKPVSSPSNPKKGGFKNLHNSFMEAVTPGKSTPSSGKGKERAIDVDTLDDDGFEIEDTTMQVDSDSIKREPFSWSKKLLTLLFSYHVLQPKAGALGYARAFPLLLHAQLPVDADATLLAAYTDLCTRLVATIGEVVSGSSEPDDLALSNAICQNLVAMAGVLLELKQTELLIAALSLIATLAIHVRVFVTSLLLHSASAASHRPAVVILSKCVETYIDQQEDAQAKRALDATLLVLESLVWEPDAAEFDGFDLLLRDTDTFAMLLREQTAPSVLLRSLRLLMVIAGQKRLFRAVMAIPMPSDGKPIDSRLPIVERLGSLLAINREGCHQLHLLIFNLVSVIADQHADAVTLLTKTGSLLARVMALIRRDTRQLYETDGWIFDGQEEELDKLMTRIAAAVQLVHYLVCSPESNVDINKILSDQRVVPGARLMFTVSIGRLAYADPPEWLSKSQQKALEHVGEAASAILDKELFPEELDQLYTLFADAIDSEATEDEEVMVIN